jgi:Protein of unknown function (DUF3102)
VSEQPNSVSSSEKLATTALIRTLKRRLITDVIEIGRLLRECRALLVHGQWISWLNREFQWSERTARNFIAAYELAKDKSANFADLNLNISSIYLLAAPSTSKKARDEVLHRAEGGESLTYGEVKCIVAAEKRAVAVDGRKKLSVKEVIRERHGDFATLPAIERQKVLEKYPRDGDLAISDAVVRQSWKPAFKELADALEAIELLTKRSVPKIIAVIPAEQTAATVARIRDAIKLLRRLQDKLQHREIMQRNDPSDDKSLSDLFASARRQFGRVDVREVVQSAWPDLNASQIATLRSGKYGRQAKAAADALASRAENEPFAEDSRRS